MKVLGSLLAAGDDPVDLARAKTLLESVTVSHADDVEAWLDLAALLERSSHKAGLGKRESVCVRERGRERKKEREEEERERDRRWVVVFGR